MRPALRTSSCAPGVPTLIASLFALCLLVPAAPVGAASGTGISSSVENELQRFALSLVRLILGPSLADRVVAVDLLAAFAVGIMTVTAITRDTPELMQPALVLAFVAFLATVAFAVYIAKGEGKTS